MSVYYTLCSDTLQIRLILSKRQLSWNRPLIRILEKEQDIAIQNLVNPTLQLLSKDTTETVSLPSFKPSSDFKRYVQRHLKLRNGQTCCICLSDGCIDFVNWLYILCWFNIVYFEFRSDAFDLETHFCTHIFKC